LDGSLYYPATPAAAGSPAAATLPFPSIIPHGLFDLSVVNGKVWPYLSVQAAAYRFRFLVASNARFYSLALFEYDEAAQQVDLSRRGPDLVQIGGDQGFLPRPVKIADRLTIGGAERADVLVDFAGFEGKSLLLHNDARAPFSLPFIPEGPQLPDVMLFRVAAAPVDPDGAATPPQPGTAAASPEPGAADSAPSAPPAPSDPAPASAAPGASAPASPTDGLLSTRLPAFVPVCPLRTTRQRDVIIGAELDSFGRIMLEINGLRFEDPTVDFVPRGATEQWNILNGGKPTHTWVAHGHARAHCGSAD